MRYILLLLFIIVAALLMTIPRLWLAAVYGAHQAYIGRPYTGGASAVEIERRYREFDEEAVRKKLGEPADIRLMRAVYYNPPQSLHVLRVRSETGRNGTTAAIATKDKTEPYPVETEVAVAMEEGVDLLDKLGFERKYEIEKVREIFDYSGAEVVFDHMPGLPPYIEIEAPAESVLLKVENALGLHQEKPFGPAALYHAEYGTGRDGLSLASFSDPRRSVITKNEDTFDARLLEQKDRYSSIITSSSSA